MLVLSRKLKQEILIGENIKITVLKVKGNTVRLGIEAPRDVHVVRGELPQFSEEPIASGSTDSNESANPIADFTVVFSNDDQGNSPKVDVIPFESNQRVKATSSVNADQHCSTAEESVRSIRFRDQLPNALHHNRLKEMVDQLTTKSNS